MCGDYELPFEFYDEKFSIRTEASRDGFTYTREVQDDVVSKQILTDTAVLNLSPIEPMNLPMTTIHLA